LLFLSQTPNPKPQTPNPKPQTPNPITYRLSDKINKQMGLCQQKIPYYKEVVFPNSEKDKKIQKIYSPMTAIEHKDNINNRFTFLQEIIKDKYTNDGIFKTHQFVSKVGKMELENQVNEFWGNSHKKPEWMAIRPVGTFFEWLVVLRMKVID
jgi:hypothetical protein